MHVEKHQVRVFDQLLHAGGEARARCPVNHPVVRADAEADIVGLLDAEAVLVRRIVDELGDAVCLPDRDYRCLRPQNGRHEVAATDVAHRRHAEGAIVEVGLRQAAIGRALTQVLQVIIDLENALGLDGLDVRHCEAVRAIDRNAEVVVVLEHVALDVAVRVQVVVDVRVHHGELGHCDRARLDEEGQHRQVSMHLLHLLAEQDQCRRVHVVREREGRDAKSLCHRLRHRLLHPTDLLDPTSR